MRKPSYNSRGDKRKVKPLKTRTDTQGGYFYHPIQLNNKQNNYYNTMTIEEMAHEAAKQNNATKLENGYGVFVVGFTIGFKKSEELNKPSYDQLKAENEALKVANAELVNIIREVRNTHYSLYFTKEPFTDPLFRKIITSLDNQQKL